MLEKWLNDECDCSREAHLGMKPHDPCCSIYRIRKKLAVTFEAGFWIGWLVAVLMCLLATSCASVKEAGSRVFPLVPEDCRRPCAEEYQSYVWQHDTGMRPRQQTGRRRK